MQEDAISELKGFNVNHIDSIEVPGAFELSQAAEKFIGSYDAVLALGTLSKEKLITLRCLLMKLQGPYLK